jgi:hypothetical protein
MADAQIIELMGRNRLVNELLGAGLEVALPLRDRGIDLIAYADLGSKVNAFIACPIQMKAASNRSFSINRKYEKFPILIHAFVWGLQSPDQAETYALTNAEAVVVGDAMGYTATPSWRKGAYSTQQPSGKLMELISPYRMSPEKWYEKVAAVAALPGFKSIRIAQELARDK